MDNISHKVKNKLVSVFFYSNIIIMLQFISFERILCSTQKNFVIIDRKHYEWILLAGPPKSWILVLNQETSKPKGSLLHC